MPEPFTIATVAAATEVGAAIEGTEVARCLTAGAENLGAGGKSLEAFVGELKVDAASVAETMLDRAQSSGAELANAMDKVTGMEAVEARNEASLRTRNWELAGTVHPETRVPFEKDTVRLSDGTMGEGVFPEFSAPYETKLSDDLLKASDYQQSQYCNERLREELDRNPSLKEKFNEYQVQQIRDSVTPDGFTWHHHQQMGRMQLVDTVTHLRTGHTGGKEIWGGGR